jgi:signal transduction histidine kinase
VRSLCQEFTAQHGIAIELRCPKMPAAVVIPDDVARALFRVAQEGLRNVARHSGVTAAIVELTGTAEDVRLRVDDRGCGFDLDTAMSSGIGLVSMRERIISLGGRCAIATAPANGTRIDVTVPIARVP